VGVQNVAKGVRKYLASSAELSRPDQPRSVPRGIIPANITKPGRIGWSPSPGTLTYQMMYELADFGFSSAVGIGGDPIIGTTHIDCLQAFQDDPDTDANRG